VKQLEFFDHSFVILRQFQCRLLEIIGETLAPRIVCEELRQVRRKQAENLGHFSQVRSATFGQGP
jgi:hypothetical protein